MVNLRRVTIAIAAVCAALLTGGALLGAQVEQPSKKQEARRPQKAKDQILGSATANLQIHPGLGAGPW